MGRFCILNFTPFSQNNLLTMKYCSVKDCKCTSSCENVILHTIMELWILVITLTANYPFKYFQKPPPSTVICRLTFGSEACAISKGLA